MVIMSKQDNLVDFNQKRSNSWSRYLRINYYILQSVHGVRIGRNTVAKFHLNYLK